MFKLIILKIIKFYQVFISPNFIQHCRFYPSCSEYAFLAVEKYGIFSGCWKGVKRIFKCHPWNPGGVNLP